MIKRTWMITIIILLSIGTLFFLGSGITGLATKSDAPSVTHNNQQIYVGLMIIIIFVVFLTVLYENKMKYGHRRQ
jgi:hypothetical protein